VIFLVLLAVLGKFAWPPIVQALEEREQRIADHIAAAEARHQEAKAVLAQHEAKLAAAADEVRELLEEARRDAEHTKCQIVAEARTAAQAEHDRAVREVHQATDVAMKQLAETSATLAVTLAGKVVQEELSAKHQDRLVREAIGRLTTVATPSQN
jgi:F-type H+-transporting ATPase subunit b